MLILNALLSKGGTSGGVYGPVPVVKTDMHVAGGLYTTQNERMSFSTFTWTAVPNAMPMNQGDGCWGSSSTEVFHIGGHHANTNLSFEIYRFSLTDNTWTAFNNEFSGTCHSNGSSLCNLTDVYMVSGGAWAAPYTNVVRKFAISSYTGASPPGGAVVTLSNNISINIPNSRGAAGVDTTGYVLGLQTSTAYKMTYSTDLWSIIPGVSSSRYMTGGISSGLHVYTIGGRLVLDDTPYTTDVSRFTVSTQTLVDLPSGNVAYGTEQPCSGTNQVVAFTGGGSESGVSVNKFTFSSETGTSGPSLLVSSYMRTGC